jgi:primary-amine oxidase
MFYQDGSIEFEIRLTGILQVYVAGDDERSKFATKIAPNLNAQYHQHFFSIRVDPMIDGLQNSVVETDIIPLPDAPTGSPQNFAGNAFITQDTVLKSESGRSHDYQKDRRWTIVNPTRKHYSSGKDVGYTIGMKGGATPVMSRADGWVLRRAEFLNEALWVCRDVEGPKGGRMWPAGKYVPQTREEPDDSISKWVQRKGNVENEDIVLFLTIGIIFTRFDMKYCGTDVSRSQARHIFQDLKTGLCKLVYCSYHKCRLNPICIACQLRT